MNLPTLHDLERAVGCVPRPKARHCACCGKRVGRFLPYRGGWAASEPLMRALSVVGSDLDRFGCPWCGAHDRERHLLLYMRATGFIERLAGRRVVHFAPERRLSAILGAATGAGYQACDLYPDRPGVARVDIEAMPFETGSVDVLLANHVLEHVDDDLRALADIARVLAPGGVAILQTPFSPVLHLTWSDPGIVGPLARLSAYGQEDHVRLYGRDIFERFASAGLEPAVLSHAEVLPGVDPDAAGVNPQEPLMQFLRPG